ncbi:MAG: GIY-YIG nuclease family protein [Sphingobacterium sp.]
MKHSVYIITDSNRAYLEVGYCTDITNRLHEIKNSATILFGKATKLSNIVYIANFQTQNEAKQRQQELQQFTRMQRERIIRMKNPNWLNLVHLTSPIETKKVVVYA